MIIRTSKNIDPLSIEHKGNKTVFTHTEAVEHILQDNYERRKDRNNGWSAKRTMRHIFQFSNLGYLKAIRKYPEILWGDKAKQAKAVHKMSLDPEFEPYKVVNGGI